MNKIEQLIEKYKKVKQHKDMKKNNMQHILMSMILEDLQSLQEPTEERDEVEIKGYDYWMDEWQCTLWDCVCWYKQLRIDSKYCSWCWAKIKRID